jgi:ribosomal protein L11 methyltransferase
MNSFYQVDIPAESQDEKDILIARLDVLGFEGYEETRNVLRAFIPESSADEAAIRIMMEDIGLTYTISLVPQRNWNAEWEAGFRPVVVDEFCAIRASFHEPVEGVQHEIIITPKMSFGTGHHATTYMMVEAMRDIEFTSKSVIDFGTGTGILSILAEKLGAAAIEAVDCDDWSIENAKENIMQNACARIGLYKADSIDGLKQAHVVLANINRNIILQHFKSITEKITNGGLVVFSGLLSGDFDEISDVAQNEYQLTLLKKNERSNWICLVYGRY